MFQKCLIWLCKQALPVSLHFRHEFLPDLPDLGGVDLLLLQKLLLIDAVLLGLHLAPSGYREELQEDGEAVFAGPEVTYQELGLFFVLAVFRSLFARLAIHLNIISDGRQAAVAEECCCVIVLNGNCDYCLIK